MLNGDAACFALFSLLSRLAALGDPGKICFDETYYVPAARDMLAGAADPNWVHPPLAKKLIEWSIRLFGDKPFAWRLPSCIASSAATGVFYLLALRWLGAPAGAALATLLYMLDGITFVQARIAMLDMPMTAFFLAAIYFFSVESYWLCSVCAGLSISCKWSGCFAFLFFLLACLCSHMPLVAALWLCARLILAAVAVYAVVFWAFSRNQFQVFSRQLSMLKSNLGLNTSAHPCAVSCWRLIFLIQPVWLHWDKESPRFSGILCLPNPLLWWLGLLAAAALLGRLNDETARLIVAGFASVVAPWALMRRGGKFMYYMLPASPFLALALAYWGRGDIWLGGAVVLASLLCFLWFFPLYSNGTISREALRRRAWLPGWGAN